MTSLLWQRQQCTRVVISEFISLDAMLSSIDEMAQRTDALLYGRRTWQVMAGAWPARAGDPFGDGVARRFDLVSATTATAGVQICRYQRARVATGSPG